MKIWPTKHGILGKLVGNISLVNRGQVIVDFVS